MDNIDQIINFYLEESKKTSMSRTTKKTKIKRATSQLASIEARKRNDPLYVKMKKHKDLYLKYREKIHKKYNTRVLSKARK